jgi:hypothetical protein
MVNSESGTARSRAVGCYDKILKMSKISEILIREFKNTKRINKIIDFSEAKRAKEELSKFNSGLSKIDRNNDMDISHKVYVQIQNMLSYFSEEVSVFNEFTEYYDALEELDFEFMPSYPPMSPITNSYFSYFCLCDLRFGKHEETICTIFRDIGKEYDYEELFIKSLDNLIQSSMRFYLNTKVEDGLVELKDILTGEKEICVSTSKYLGKTNEIWFVRLVPNLDDRYNYKIVLNTPYIILRQNEEDWIKYFERQGIKKGDLDIDRKILKNMKYNVNMKYWLNYIMDGYVNYESNCIFLTGIPDIKGSKPHEL